MIRRAMRLPGPATLHQRPAAMMMFAVVIVYFLVWVALTTSGDDVYTFRMSERHESDEVHSSTMFVPTVEVDFPDGTTKMTMDFESTPSTIFTTLSIPSTTSLPPDVRFLDNYIEDEPNTSPYTFFTTLSTPAVNIVNQPNLPNVETLPGKEEPLVIPVEQPAPKPGSPKLPPENTAANQNASKPKGESNQLKGPAPQIAPKVGVAQPPPVGQERDSLDIPQSKQQSQVQQQQQQQQQQPVLKQKAPVIINPDQEKSADTGRSAQADSSRPNEESKPNTQRIIRSASGGGVMQFGYLPDDNNTQSGPATNVQARTTVLRSIYNLTKAVMSRSRVPVMDKPKPNCTVYKHVVYVKISETGSTMFFDVMRRFALKYSLARALPRFRMHFYGDENVALIPRPAKIKQRFVRIDRPQQRFDVMYHHMVFDGDIVSRVMPRDTFYVTMLRYPWAQFKSVLNKYNLLQKYAPGNDTAIELEQFLENPYKYWRNGSVRTSAFSRNGMMMELGFPDETEDVRNDDLVIQAYIKYLEQRFGLVMLVEFLDQSLILLRRMLCWEMEDILYTPMEGNNYPFKGNKDQKLISAHQKWSKADYAVYRHFKEKLLGLINKQPAEFHDEVLLFKRALEYVKICGSPSNVRILRRKGKPYASDDVINCSSQPVRKIT